MNLKNRETEIKLFLWQNPHDQKWHVVDIAGYRYGESLNPQKAVNNAVELGVPQDDIDTEEIL